MSHSEDPSRAEADRPHRMVWPPPQVPSRRTLSRRLEGRARRQLPPAAYHFLLRRYHGLRAAAGRDPGVGHLLPDFVVIGAAKAGTTSLYAWLCEHPSVEPASVKEVRYLDFNFFRGENWYRKHFPLESDRTAAAERGDHFITGEASPTYMYNHWAPQRLAELVPQAKLLVALREPVDRAFSHFQMSRREDEEPLQTFRAAVAAEEERLRADLARSRADPSFISWPIKVWSYLMGSRYAEQLERWLEFFPLQQFHFVTLDDLAAQPHETMDRVHEFLGLSPYRHETLVPLLKARYDSLDPQDRTGLTEYFEPHNRRLYDLLGRDFGWAASPPSPQP